MINKSLIITLGLLLCGPNVISQKYDYNYLETGSVDPKTPGVFLQYDDSLGGVNIRDFRWYGRSNVCPALSDKDGKLLAYTNNLAMWDSIGRIAINGDSLEVGFNLEFYREYQRSHIGIAVAQGVGFIPITDSLFYYFHNSSETWQGAPDWAVGDIRENDIGLNSYSEGLWLTKVRLRADGRMYILEEEKQIQLINDIVGYGQLMFIKKPNGLDWWIKLPQVKTDSAHLFSLYVDQEQLVYEGLRYFSEDNGRVCNTPQTSVSFQGDQLARMYGNCETNGLWNKVELFDFDRVTGEATRQLIDSFPDILYCSYVADVEFSENGRFLYIAIGQYIYQCDLTMDNPITNKVIIAEWDGFLDGRIPPYMDQMWRLPNGKILVAGLTSDSYLHYIHEPNLPGDSCQFEIRALQTPPLPDLPDRNIPFTALPTFPQYRMCAMDVICDTITTILEENDHNTRGVFISLYPNPSSHISSVQIHGARIEYVRLVDLHGRLLIGSQSGVLDVSKLNRGVYWVQVVTNRGRYVEKLVVP